MKFYKFLFYFIQFSIFYFNFSVLDHHLNTLFIFMLGVNMYGHNGKSQAVISEGMLIAGLLELCSCRLCIGIVWIESAR